MGGIRALFGIFSQAPGAIWSGRFDVDETHSVYGLPARIVGVLLMCLGIQAVVLTILGAVKGKKGIPDAVLAVGGLVFLGCIVTSAVICVVFRKRRRLPEPERDDEDDEEDDDDRRRKPSGPRYWGPGR